MPDVDTPQQADLAPDNDTPAQADPAPGGDVDAPAAPEPNDGAPAAAPAGETAPAAPATPPAAPTPAATRLNAAGAACLAAAREGRCLYRGKAGYSLSGTGGKQHTFPVVAALVKAGLLRDVPSGGAHGSVKITDTGLKALRRYQTARPARA